ncbi:MAG TPA: urate hydroxylase PuuD [Steroidobacteraceae bacterium]|nr:urate hydroxylase PuuD [Steroidobacteraceae bacterium]
MTAYFLDWLSLLGRWLHLVAGIAWIGSSFYFIWLDDHLVAPADPALAKEGVAGELWAVHGGGFYHSQKYRVAPASLPASLHWFYWEAYTTFLSGLFLMGLIYYAQAELYLIDPAVAALSKPAAIAIGIAFLGGGWIVYDGLCRSPLGRSPRALAAVLAVLLSAAAWVLCHLFGGRGAYMEFGAMLGTIMVANVFFVIIPAQRALVRAKELEGNREPDPTDAIAAKLRSTHNTYFTLPVLFVMISHHYPMTYGARQNWLVLIAICAAGVLLRVYFVARHKARDRGGRTSPLPAALGVAALAAVALALLPPRSPQLAAAVMSSPGSFARIEAIIARRCASCHSLQPTQEGFTAAPNGVLLDTPERIVSRTQQMREQLATRAMPVGNVTGITEEERAEMLAWIDRGAPH